MKNPLEQFELNNLVNIYIKNLNFSFTNSSLFMMLNVLVTSVFFGLALKKTYAVPGRMQSTAELVYNFILNTLNENTSGKGTQFLPFIMTIFMFVITLNLFGILPYGFTVTSHISITFGLAIVIFITVTIIAFIKHGLHFFSFFLPQGTPLFLAPLMIVIELFTYLTRPLSLSIRLAANMIVGHILIAVIASFISLLGIFGIMPMLTIVVFNGFELFVAILQAYIFTILSCVYLNDAINLH